MPDLSKADAGTYEESKKVCLWVDKTHKQTFYFVSERMMFPGSCLVTDYNFVVSIRLRAGFFSPAAFCPERFARIGTVTDRQRPVRDLPFPLRDNFPYNFRVRRNRKSCLRAVSFSFSFFSWFSGSSLCRNSFSPNRFSCSNRICSFSWFCFRFSSIPSVTFSAFRALHNGCF